MNTEEIHSLERVSFKALYTAWEDAFRDYERTWTYDELQQLLRRRGYEPGLSFGAFDKGELVSFILNCPGIYYGKLTAYDAGTGTIKSHRGRGLVKKIFDAALPLLKDRGIKQYLLEVLQHNTGAVNIYSSSGFTINRNFNYYVQSMEDLPGINRTLSPQYEMRETGLDRIDEMRRMWDFEPSWQNSFDSIQRVLKDFIIKGVFEGDILAGYGISDPSSGDITQLAVAAQHRRKGIGRALLKDLLSYNRHPAMKVINTDTRDTGTHAFLGHNGIGLRGQQYEMIMDV
jgi:ribosomal protein S18 acetylase RimI-like enzyme